MSAIAQHFDKDKGLSSEETEEMLSLNSELRRLHDAGPALIGEGFDEAYEPLGGYGAATERFLER